MQTNEVQRSWALLPAFLSLDAPRLDLLELGSSAGLNLVWDRYRYRYAAGTWGRARRPTLELVGDERRAVPASLLSRSVEVVRRRGVDLEPIDATADEAKLLLRSFVWADQTDRLDRLERALAALAADPPELIQGDYVDLLPELLNDRVDDALLVVFQTASTQYLSPERYAELRESLAHADRPVALDLNASTRGGGDEPRRWLRARGRDLPGQTQTMVARLGYHGQWLEWLG